MLRRWTAYLVVSAFLAGVGLCLMADAKDTDFNPGSASTLTHTTQPCDASLVPCEDQSGANKLFLTSFLDTEQNSFYKGVSLPPPFPPPRG